MSGYDEFNAQAGSTSSKTLERAPEYYEYFRIKPGQKKRLRVLRFPIERRFIHIKWTGKFPIKITCTIKSEDTQGKCVGCVYADKDSGEDNIFTTYPSFLTVYDKTKYHSREKDGKIEKKECIGSKCKICAHGLDISEEGRKYWELSGTRFGLIKKANIDIGGTCGSCKTGEISITSLLCPKCGEPIFTEDQLSDMKEESIRAEAAKQYMCQSCNHKDFPEKGLTCSEGCEKPEPASVYDTDLIVENVPSADEKGKSTLIVTPTMKFEPLTDEMKAVESYEWDKVFPELSLDMQAKLFKVKNPYGVSEDVIEKDTGGSHEEEEQDWDKLFSE